MSRVIDKLIKKLNDKKRMILLDILESPIKLNLIRFYKANPFSIHTPQGLANIIGRRADQVYKEIENLANAGVLKKISENGGLFSVYSYEPEEEIASIIDMLVEISNDERELMANLHNLIKNN